MKKLFLSFSFVLLLASGKAQEAAMGLNVNEKAPMFSAADQSGSQFKLKSMLKKGPVVLVFYRGQWCPFCNKQLMKLQDSLSLIIAKGASLVAITPEKPMNITKTIEKTKATFPILYDDGLKIMKSFDVAFAVDATTIEKYKKYGIDFAQANGEANGANLPVPAVYVIGQNGKIVYKYFDTDYRKRASVKDILDAL